MNIDWLWYGIDMVYRLDVCHKEGGIYRDLLAQLTFSDLYIHPLTQTACVCLQLEINILVTFFIGCLISDTLFKAKFTNYEAPQYVSFYPSSCYSPHLTSNYSSPYLLFLSEKSTE
jgi:hypothetical protein